MEGVKNLTIKSGVWPCSVFGRDTGEYQAQRSLIMMARMQQVRGEMLLGPTWDS